jgi:CheY-like chemotaxis protein
LHTVLLVDDNKNIREFCRRELEKCGYRVLVAAHGLEALNLCDAGSPDVVVLDVRMPGIDGLETNERLFSLYPDIPVILHTAHRGDLGIDLHKGHIRALVEKSDDIEALRETIIQVLDRPERRRAHA